MRYDSLPVKSLKMEEQEVPETTIDDSCNGGFAGMDEFDGILDIEDEEKLSKDKNMYGFLNWDFMDMEEQPNINGEDEADEYCKFEDRSRSFFEEEESHFYSIKRESSNGFLLDGEDDDKRVSLNLNLNYQEVLDAWSDRGPLWADHSSLSCFPNNAYYMGEVPVMEEERTRREASVLRYKEKRQTRLFSKKIRYQVRKLNADKRPRLKGRFVKRDS
ncbi:zinc finger protein CONSTANS-LIKE 7 [Manihot esculenta]|uniref:CCT domain-containing protein n=1 Tax=Manihot esculenta TaxID=3983 RepID=A0A2C9WG07_MANES|nr:zinc finger protein CONSTANS-LIKE 7 [Manihot esculenta]OAY58920.1 hypothetical protein MANES_02G216600v8 [Manihot esculenta]